MNRHVYGPVPSRRLGRSLGIDLIQPDRVQLNTVFRPPAEQSAVGVSENKLRLSAPLFNPPGEIIAGFPVMHERTELLVGFEDVLAMLRRCPCSIEDIGNGLGMHRNEVIKYLDILSRRRSIEKTTVLGRAYYQAPGVDRD